MANVTPRIYVTCLASYNAGRLHGTWIDDCTDEDALNEAIAEMLRASPCPNVEVDCPDCQGTGNHKIETLSVQVETCSTCKGSGKVPSAEEWAIHDHEGFGDLIGEHASIEDVAKHARMIGEHDGAWIAYVGHVGAHYATEDGFQDAYHGQHSSAEDYAQQLAEDCGLLPTNKRGESSNPLLNYIDWERYARDLEYDGYYFADDGEGGVYVFSR